MIYGQNILQYEFFHVGGNDASSLEEVIVECSKRVRENSEMVLAGHQSNIGIKTVIRIYDLDGVVTYWATQIVKLEEQKKTFWVRPHNSFLKKWWVRLRIKMIRKKTEQYRLEISKFAVEYLNRSFYEFINIAIEQADRTFRPVEESEMFELVQSVQKAKDMWLFIFEPNNLLAVENRSVVNIM